MDSKNDIKIINEVKLLRKFIIYDDSKLIQSRIFRIETTDDSIKKINNSEINTGIMISNLNINSILIYLCILDDKIFIIKQINISKYHEYFNEHKEILMFITDQCKKDF